MSAIIPDINFELSKMKKNPILFRNQYIAVVEWKNPSRARYKFDKTARIADNYLTVEECRLGIINYRYL